MSKIRLFEAFAGIGTQRMALPNAESVGISEVDPYAVRSYEAIHGETNNYGDIRLIDPYSLPDMDLFTYSFPCQDISVAGRMKGLAEDTRSSLLYECEKIIRAKRPPYLLMENVKNLVSKKFRKPFENWLGILRGYGYNSYWKVLDARNFGVPQHRERVFVFSSLTDTPFSFPEGEQTDICIRDILEPEEAISENYYMNEKSVLDNNHSSNYGLKIIRKIEGVNYGIYGRVYDPDGVSPTLTVMNGGNTQPKIWTTKERIRRLTPRECWRLMGIPDSYFDRASRVNSNSQLYRQAGNAIAVPVLEAIFKNSF